jgi:hypothetical protein
MANEIEWTFPKNEGGRETGFHDAGVETFKGNFDRYLAREVIQNSLDARDDQRKPVRVEIKLRKARRDEIPDIDGLQRTFARCADYWKKTDKRASEFFKRAERLAKADEITMLQLGDYNTTGVIGSDSDREKNWYSLIRCAGSSPKSGGEGGSFGIGKNAPFAASHMRTVLYSTFTRDGGRAFQGVALLVSHALPGDETAQPTGFLGQQGGASVRSEDAIPKPFRRHEPGTDIFVLGFPASESWEDDLVYSVLENFWLAIQSGDLVVQVGHIVIDADSLAKLLERFSAKEDFTAHLYCRAFTNPSIPPIKKKLGTLGDCEVYLFAGPSDEMTKHVAMFRKTGMKVYEKLFRSIVPFCGVFICRSENGNATLREMEPPGHDKWDPDLPEKGAHRATQAELIEFIRSCIRQLWPVDDKTSLSIPGLSRYLPDDEESPEEPLDGSRSDQKKGESLDREVRPAQIPTRRIEPRKEMQPDSARRGEGDDDTGFGGHANDGDGGSDGGGVGESAKGRSGAGTGGKPAVPIFYRTFAADDAGQVYRVRIRPEAPAVKQLNAQIWTVGDDGKVPAEILSAKSQDGTMVPVKGGGIIGPLSVAQNGSLLLEISLRDPLRVAMEITAHEA